MIRVSSLKYLFTCLLLSFIATAANGSQTQEVDILFEVHTNPLPENDTVYIAGSHEKLGSWHPALVPFTRISDSLWQLTISVRQGITLEYKFTRGSWHTEARYNENEVPDNFSLTAVKDTTVTIYVPFWNDRFTEPIELQVTGELRYHRNLSYDSLLNRDIAVWLPPCYETDSTVHYPVLYMHDGQNMFDPATSAFGIDWQIDEAADSLIRKGIIEPVIIAGIYNTPDRGKEYLPTATSKRYMKFVVEIVKPLIDSCYRTLPSAEHTAVGGSSAGGLAAFMLAFEYPGIFSLAAALSPALKIETIDYVSVIRNNYLPEVPPKLYIDIGNDELDRQLKPGVDEMISVLKNKGYVEGIDYIYRFNTDWKHSESSWAERIIDALIFLFGK